MTQRKRRTEGQRHKETQNLMTILDSHSERGGGVRYQVTKVLAMNIEPKYQREAINKSCLQGTSMLHYELKQELSEKWGF